MSITRTYFDKNNTIVSGIRNDVNTGRNPVTEIFYGSGVSRFIFYVDLEAIRTKIADKTINLSSITKHTLKIKNTSNYDVLPFRDYRDQVQFNDKHHATSFDLELKPLTEAWDEGIGYDSDPTYVDTDEMVYLKGASNWTNRVAETAWVNEGSVSTGTTTIATQHFDKGNEDLELDITSFVNTLLATTTGHTGFCLKFTDYFEGTSENARKYVSLFTRHTHTFFEPFIETEYNDLVADDRRNVTLGQTCNLYLYVFKNVNLLNLDALPICRVGTTSFTVTQISKGIYNAQVLLPSASYNDYVMYHDVWSNIMVDGTAQPNITLDITPKPAGEYYQIGADTFEPLPYMLSVSGIKRNENMTQNELRKVLVNVRKPHTVSTIDVASDIYYRMYIKQGINQVTVIDWTQVNRSFDSNYFFVDTSWLVPQQYFVDVKLNIREETRLYTEELKFSIISVLN